MILIYIANIIGLIFEIIGVKIIYEKSLLSDLSRVIINDKNLFKNETEENKKRIIRDSKKSKIGFDLIIVGFLFQLLSCLFAIFLIIFPHFL